MWKIFESEDGEPVKDQTGGFGVQRRDRILLDAAEKKRIELFYQIISTLVEAIDRAFYGGDGGVARFGITGLVLAMPEIEVGAVLAEQQRLQIAVCREGEVLFGGSRAVRRAMPRLGGKFLQLREVSGVQHGGSGWPEHSVR